jgi:hypothetical protein
MDNQFINQVKTKNYEIFFKGLVLGIVLSFLVQCYATIASKI